jgi:hypothetical protein
VIRETERGEGSGRFIGHAGHDLLPALLDAAVCDHFRI